MENVTIAGIALVAPPFVSLGVGLLGVRARVRNTLAVVLAISGLLVYLLSAPNQGGACIGLVGLPLVGLLFGGVGAALRSTLTTSPRGEADEWPEVSVSVKEEEIGDGRVCEGVMVEFYGADKKAAEMATQFFLRLTESRQFLLGTSEILRDVMHDLSGIALQDGPLQKRWHGRMLSGTVGLLLMDRAAVVEACRALLLSPNACSFCLCPSPGQPLAKLIRRARDARSVEVLARTQSWLPLMDVLECGMLMIYTHHRREQIAAIVDDLHGENPVLNVEYEELPDA
ncbi:MAG: hypothetical protein ACLFV7_10395 [Phycisphaerae bacterium]